MTARIAVIQFPGVNCESESARALQRVGLEAEVFRWTRPAAELRDFQGYVLPGGFSYQDRVRAGALAAKEPLVEVLVEAAESGKPVLGICNGAQVLVESGLVPASGPVEMALARNRMSGRSGYYTRWVTVRIEESPCVFTRHLAPGTLLPMPMAHGEGRFTAAPGRMEQLAQSGQVPARYAREDGQIAESFPDLPNGAEQAAAGVSNERGNVLALMPHPERAQDLAGLARGIGGEWAARRDEARRRGDEAPGPGLEIFRGLARHLENA
jgi:phosphoribosylformylglycinamidine synthase